MANDSAVSKASIYEPLLPPPFHVSHNNKGAYALLMAVIMIVIAGLVVCVKLQTSASIFRKLRLDDLALITALMFALGYTITICQAVRYGLGSVAAKLTSMQVRSLSQYYYASNILLYLSLASSKCSVALLVIALEPPQRWITSTLYGILAIVISWAIAATCVAALQCGPNRWALGPTTVNTCIHQFEAQIGLRIIDIGIDVVLSVLPGVMMTGVQVPTFKRFVVTSMFGFRLATPVFTSIALASLGDFYNATVADRPFKVVAPSIWSTMALNRILTDWAAGVANAGLVEPFALQSLTGGSTTGQSYGGRSIARSQLRPNDMSKAEREVGVSCSNYACRGEDDQDRGAGDADSRKGSTDGILRTIEYDVEYDQVRNRRDNSMSSEGIN